MGKSVRVGAISALPEEADLCQIPQLDGLIIRAGQRPAAVGRDRHGLDLPGMADEPGTGFAVEGIEPQFAVLTA